MATGPDDRPKASERLALGGRLPITIWGDVLLDGSPPQVRRVLTGQSGHESVLAFFYLNELLSLDEAVQNLSAAAAQPDRPAAVTDRYAALRSTIKGQQDILNDELLQTFLPVAQYVKSVGWQKTELCELGCTFFSAIEKLAICSSLIDSHLNIRDMRFVGIDHSDYFLRGAIKFHREYKLVPLYDLSQWQPGSAHPLHLSRFVASYAFASGADFAAWLQAFSAFSIMDVITLDDAEFETSNNGLRQVFFSLGQLVEAWQAAGFAVYLNRCSPDFNSGRRCAVVSVFGIRQALSDALGFEREMAALDGAGTLVPMRPLDASTARTVQAETARALSDRQWEALAAYKRHFPIWGLPMTAIDTVADVERLTRPPSQGVDLGFSSGQIHYYVRRSLGEP